MRLLCAIHISDLHFGAMNPKLQYDILKEQFIDVIKQLPIDMVCIDGDIFDHKAMANSDLIMYALKFIDELIQEVIRPKQCTLIILGGTYNHDADQLKLFYHYMDDNTVDVRVVRNIQFEYVKDAKVLCIPELANIHQSVYNYFLFESGLYDHVCIHGTIEGSVPNNEVGNCKLFNINDFCLCRGPIIGGHVHGGGNYSKYFYYCGSPYSWRYDDDYRKGFLISLQNLDTGAHYVHKELIKSFRYETMNLDSMLNSDPKSIINYIDKVKLEKGIDYLRIVFSKDVPQDMKYMIDSFYKNNNNIKLSYTFTKEQQFIKKRFEEMNELNKYDYIYDNSLTEYDKLARYINDDMGSIFISADEIKEIVLEEI